MKLWFKNSKGIEKWIADCDTWNEVSKCIDAFIGQANFSRPEEKKFKSYYKRMWTENNRTVIDVGSWSEFFIWDGQIKTISTDPDGVAEFEYE